MRHSVFISHGFFICLGGVVEEETKKKIEPSVSPSTFVLCRGHVRVLQSLLFNFFFRHCLFIYLFIYFFRHCLNFYVALL